MTSPALAGRVALVAGATRGAGRGTAVALGEAGATVYCTGRTTRRRRSEYDRPETIEETAELVSAEGGEGIAVEVDHLDPEQVRALVERIDAEQGRLDVLVNDIWGGEKLAEWDTPVWEHDLAGGLRMLRLAVETHLITSHVALRAARAPARRTRRRDDRRHARLQRRALPALDVLRPRQGLGPAAGVRAGARAGAARLHRGGADAGLAALGDDARALRRDRGQLARRRRRSTRTSPPSRSPRGSSAAPSPRSPPTRTSSAAPAARSPPAASRASTASPTSTARSPTAGATWSRSRTPGCRPTRSATAERRPARHASVTTRRPSDGASWVDQRRRIAAWTPRSSCASCATSSRWPRSCTSAAPPSGCTCRSRRSRARSASSSAISESSCSYARRGGWS